MGCASSKHAEEAVASDVYHPPPTSFALFDVNTIEEPWLVTTAMKAVDDVERGHAEEEKRKPTAVPLPLLEKLESYEAAPKSWSEVSKVLEDLKPTLNSPPPPAAKPNPAPPPAPKKPSAPSKKSSFHTLEEVESKLKKPTPRPSSPPRAPPLELTGFRSVRENSFIVHDRAERVRQKTH